MVYISLAVTNLTFFHLKLPLAGTSVLEQEEQLWLGVQLS